MVHRGLSPYELHMHAQDLPDDWVIRPLDEILVESRLRAGDLKADEGQRLEVLSLTRTYGLIPQSERFGKRIATADVSNYKVVREGWIVYNPYVIWEGAVHGMRRPTTGVVSPVYPVWKVTDADARFVDFLLRQPFMITAYNQFASGAVNRRRSISKKDFLSIRVPLPPFPEQRAIAHVLRTVQEAIEATERAIAATKELKRSLMRHLFTYGPVPIQEVHRVPLKETEIGPVPEHWCVSAFGQVVTIESGQVDPKQAPYRNMLHIGPENVESGTGRIADLATAESLSLKSGKYLFGPQHVVYSKIRPYLAKVAAPDFAGICSADMYPLRPASEQLDKDFLFHYMLTDRFTAQAVSFQSRTGIPKINRTQLNSIPVPLPPVSEQRLVSSYLRVVTDKLLREIRSHQSTGVLFSSLLHNLMTGKVRVSEFASPETQEVM